MFFFSNTKNATTKNRKDPEEGYIDPVKASKKGWMKYNIRGNTGYTNRALIH